MPIRVCYSRGGGACRISELGCSWYTAELDKMGVPRTGFSVLALLIGLILNAGILCNGGITSSFVRLDQKAVDMPHDSDVFRVPPGYNAPEQVFSRFCS